MRIAHVIDKLNFGGAQAIAKGIVEADRGSFLISIGRSDNELDVDSPRLIKIESRIPLSLLPFFALRDIIKENKIDALHCHLFRSQYLAVFVKMSMPRLKLAFHEHGRICGSEFGNRFEEWAYIAFLRLFRNSFDLFIAISDETKKRLVEAGVPSSKITVLHNYILPKFFESTRKDNKLFTAGFASRLVERKGWKTFLDAAKALPHCRFLVAGDGPDKGKLIDYIRANQISNALYLGYQKDIVGFYSSLDCFVMPSHWEPAGLTILEAQAAGIPVIASDVAGLNEVVSAKNAMMFRAKDHKALAGCIARLARDKALAKRLSEAGKKNAGLFSLNRYMEQLKEIYNGIL